jgi:hypothetical protein
MILRGRKKISSTHNRLLLCMSGVDILNSAALAVSASAHNEAQGNKATCTAQGFFITLGFAVPLYNAMICLYYMAIIRFNLKDDVISTRYEPWMHTVALMLPLTFAIAAASFGDFRPTGGASYFDIAGFQIKVQKLTVKVNRLLCPGYAFLQQYYLSLRLL